MVSFPRDLWIPIAPDGHEQRINTAFTNGPEALIQTIKLNFQIPINHYMQVDFKGFQGLVDAVGGIELYLPGPVRDKVTGLNITDTGCVLFHGDQALSYVRSRHFQYQENGRWRSARAATSVGSSASRTSSAARCARRCRAGSPTRASSTV